MVVVLTFFVSICSQIEKNGNAFQKTPNADFAGEHGHRPRNHQHDLKSVTRLQKPDKIYLHNPNMFYALGQSNKIGTIRECFTVNQLSVKHTVEYGKAQGDFRVDGHITVEVGGQDKTFDQIAGIPDSYILADMMEYPVGKKLPLWLAGLTY
jgi:hypothetical protein